MMGKIKLGRPRKNGGSKKSQKVRDQNRVKAARYYENNKKKILAKARKKTGGK